MDNFVGDDDDGRYDIELTAGRESGHNQCRVASKRSSPALMFEEFAAIAVDAGQRERWMRTSERTQELVDESRKAANAED